jgi:Protein of unknown function, DUF547
MSDGVASSDLLKLARDGGLAPVRERLAAIDPITIAGDDARIAFWLNAYNALVLGELGERPRRGSLLRHRGLFSAEIATLGGHAYSLDQIEHGVLRLNARPPYRLRRLLRAGDPRLDAAPSRLDPRIHFALNCGAVSCPPIHPYEPAALDAQLERTTVAYLRAETSVDRARGRLELPYLMRLYRADFDDPAAFAAARLEPGDATWVEANAPTVRFGDFDWTLAER